MAQKSQDLSSTQRVTTSYGYNATEILMQHSIPVQGHRMTLEQAEAMHTLLGDTIAAFKAQKPQTGANG